MWRNIFLYFLRWSLVLYICLPLFFILLMSFTLSWRWPAILPLEWNLRNWQYVFSSSFATSQAMLNSLSIAGAVTLINLVLAIPAADVLARKKIRAQLWIEAVLLAPLIISPVVSMMGFHMLFIRIGWTDSWGAIVMAHILPTFPYMLRSLMVSYRTLGFQWEEQALMLSANTFQRFTFIVIPYILPGMVVGIGLSLLVSLSQYVITFVIGGGQILTLPIVMLPYFTQGDTSIAAVYSILFSLLAIVALYGSGWMLKLFYRRGFTLAERN